MTAPDVTLAARLPGSGDARSHQDQFAEWQARVARELVLRVQSILRRTSTAIAPEARPLVDGDLRVDPRARTASRGGIPLALTAREFDLLAHLLGHPERAFTRTDLLREVWGWEFGDESTVTVHVRRLREKVEDDPAAPRRISTVWGVGYRWDPTPAAAIDGMP